MRIADIFQSTNREIEDQKRSVTIGIFGSFRGENLECLKKIRDYLKSSGWGNAKISCDVAPLPNDSDGGDRDQNNYRMSKKLIEDSEICIILFFDDEGDNTINQAALIELGTMNAQMIDQVLVLHSKEFIPKRGSILRGAVLDAQYCIEDEFEDCDNTVLERCLLFCHDYLLRKINNVT